MQRDVPVPVADRPQIAIQDQQMQASKETSTRQTHLAGHERAALSALVARLHQHYGNDLRRVVLFGSKARGDFNSESDLDVLVVVSIMRSQGLLLTRNIEQDGVSLWMTPPSARSC